MGLAEKMVVFGVVCLPGVWILAGIAATVAGRKDVTRWVAIATVVWVAVLASSVALAGEWALGLAVAVPAILLPVGMSLALKGTRLRAQDMRRDSGEPRAADRRSLRAGAILAVVLAGAGIVWTVWRVLAFVR